MLVIRSKRVKGRTRYVLDCRACRMWSKGSGGRKELKHIFAAILQLINLQIKFNKNLLI